MKKVEINGALVRSVLDTVDKGLVKGLGTPIPGKMCVEAAVCYAMGLPHSDRPTCVGEAVRSFKIALNDSQWSSDKARAEGMRLLAVAQLGSDGIDQVQFCKIVAEETIRQILPIALRAAAVLNPASAGLLEQAAVRCERERAPLTLLTLLTLLLTLLELLLTLTLLLTLLETVC